ncbi:HAE1 family hydrophobic/amphiphilic exporter-1 [Paenibacillus sp. BK033]|uniref:efflux RND transporter permease subunit n=1 Tax=Paenibacillus sp. BK033 TaxID=2512133 RepID=UPI001049A41B|nr:efflux RND transporter permease subunit [Paenibacillus sp. BK033]TCN01479.1 HAE1 family hydrophobic/amphiphilic exporter-1 [Paenibacillus sp. BK033]
MKSMIKFSLNNKFALWIMTVIVLFAGLYSGLNMKMETLPDITVPIVSVTTVLPGAAPEEVMEKVTKPIEQQTRNMEGVDSVSSTSFENASSVIIQYKFGTDMDKAESEVKSLLADLKLPEGAQDPDVSRISLNAFPVISLSFANDKQDLAQLTDLVNSSILPELQGISGVADVQISGQNVLQGQLAFDQAKLAQLGLTEDAVKGIIQASAMKAPLGIFEFGDSEKAVVVDGNVSTEEDLNNLILMPNVKLSDVAKLTVEGKAESVSRTNGKDSIGINIVKAADANTVDVVNNVKDAIKAMEEKNDGLTIVTTLDQGAPIEKSVETMLSKAVIGALFAVVIIMIFLRDIRSTVIAVVSIPLSILIALLILSRMDITLNIMTLGAMTIAIGRVIDDSIVVIENVYRRMALKGEKLKGKELILDATREMFVPIMSSTIVTIAVFLPLSFVSGMVGEIFTPFALTVVFALLASLLVAITVVPMLAHMMFRNGIKEGKAVDHDKHGRLATWYKGILAWSLNHKVITSVIAIVLLVGSLSLTPLIGMSFLPGDEQKSMIVTYNPAPGETKEQVEEMALKAEKELMKREGIDIVQYAVGGQNPMNPGASKQALFNLTYDEDMKNFSDEKDQIVPLLQKLGGKGEWKEQNFGAGGGVGGSTISMVVYGPDMDSLDPVVTDLMNKLKENKDLEKVDSSLSERYEQYRIVADQAKMSQYGLTAGQVAMALSPVRDNPVLTTIKKDNEDVNVYVKVDTKTYKEKSDLENVMLKSPVTGAEVALKDVVKIEEGKSPNTITRLDDRINAEVTADVVSSNVSAVSSDLQKTIDGMKLPAGVEIKMGGVTEDMQESFTQLGLAMLAAIAVVYLVLVITFGGALTPFAILFSLPFTVIGALVGLWIAGETISVTALIGMLMLIGIVVTNAIVLVDRVIHKQKEGLSVRESLLEAAGTRLRPILMTAIATVGALLPLAFGFESGGLISKGMAITVIGGLISSTLLTLIFVPMVYELFNRRKKAKAIVE